MIARKFDKKCFDKIEYNINNLFPDLSQNDSTFLIKTLAERDSVAKLLLIELIQNNSYSDFLSSTSLLHEELKEGSSNIERILELHLNKVEHEYTNITIWAAVLTILFLVFSFYSLFRLEELKKEAKDNLQEIKSEHNTVLSQIGNTKTELETYKATISTYIPTVKSSIETAINSIKDTANVSFQETIEDYNKKTLKSIQEFDKEMFEKTQKFDNYITEVSNFVSKIEPLVKSSIESVVNMRVDELTKPHIEILTELIKDYQDFVDSKKRKKSQNATNKNKGD